MTLATYDFTTAVSADIADISHLMTAVKASMQNKDWFVADDEAYLYDILQDHGFILLAKSDIDSSLAGFFVVKFPGLSEDNLGRHLDFSNGQLLQCAHMDSCVIHPNHRGNHLQSRMALLAEQKLARMNYSYLLATIHPNNCYSMNSMLRCGYQPQKETCLYGGLRRIILLKKI